MCSWDDLHPMHAYPARIGGEETWIEIRFEECMEPLEIQNPERSTREYGIPAKTIRQIRRDHACWLKHAGENGLGTLRAYAPYAARDWNPEDSTPFASNLTRQPTKDEMDFFMRGLEASRKGQYLEARLR